MRQLAAYEDQIATCEAVSNARLQEFVRKWKFGRISHWFGVWKGISGFDEVVELCMSCA